MGWCSGTIVFDVVCDAVLGKKENTEKLLELLIDTLKDMDWDCESESEYFHHPKVKAAFIKLGYEDYYEDEDEYIDISETSVVMTGFRDTDLQEEIENAGGKVTSSVSGKTTHLLIAGKSAQDGSSKLDKARELGVRIMSPAEFKKEYGLE